MVSLLRYFFAVAMPAIFAAGQASGASLPNPLTLHSFCSQSHCMDGAQSWGGVVRGPDGAYYGITYGGGDPQAQGSPYGPGVVYRITSKGRFSVLHRLDASSDGAGAESNLTLGADGNFYGVTGSTAPDDYGHVVRISPTGDFTVVHRFMGADNGAGPYGEPVEDAEGNWYGTTLGGGRYAEGTIYKISSTGVFQKLHDFTSTDGADPVAALVLARDGNFYGTTELGGVYNAGTVFRVTPSGTFKTLHDFDFTEGGFYPVSALVAGPDGALYGSTVQGAAGNEFGGTAFRITLKGQFTSLHSFGDGVPTSALTLMPDGNFYGVSINDGLFSQGTIYRISPAGSYSKLYDFPKPMFGMAPNPHSTLVRGPGNTLFGTTVYGGAQGEGSVFRYAPTGSR